MVKENKWRRKEKKKKSRGGKNKEGGTASEKESSNLTEGKTWTNVCAVPFVKALSCFRSGTCMLFVFYSIIII